VLGSALRIRDYQSEVRRSRSALATTLTEDNDIAAALIAGESVIPKSG